MFLWTGCLLRNQSLRFFQGYQKAPVILTGSRGFSVFCYNKSLGKESPQQK